MSGVSVRAETPDDVDGIRHVIAEAFRRPEAHDTDPIEVALVDALRQDPAWIAPLSLVAEEDGHLVGQVLCTRATIDGVDVLGLGPIGVLPDAQGRGVGTSLMHSAILAASLHGVAVICLLGSPDFYGRFGFVPAASIGVDAPDPAWGDNFQALVAPGTVVPTGQFTYAAPFSAFE